VSEKAECKCASNDQCKPVRNLRVYTLPTGNGFPITSNQRHKPAATSNIPANRRKTGAISIIQTAYIIFRLKS